MNRKKDLAAYVQKVEGVTLNPDSIFDIQSKRLHEYKRQQMNLWIAATPFTEKP